PDCAYGSGSPSLSTTRRRKTPPCRQRNPLSFAGATSTWNPNCVGSAVGDVAVVVASVIHEVRSSGLASTCTETVSFSDASPATCTVAVAVSSVTTLPCTGSATTPRQVGVGSAPNVASQAPRKNSARNKRIHDGGHHIACRTVVAAQARMIIWYTRCHSAATGQRFGASGLRCTSSA